MTETIYTTIFELIIIYIDFDTTKLLKLVISVYKN